MELSHLSAEYFVRKLHDGDIDRIYDLSKENTIFYRYHPPFVTKESIAQDMNALPPGKGYDDKYYIGFFKKDKLIALMDLICDYPEEKVIHIGLFMIDPAFQGKGIGTSIIGECLTYWKSLGYRKVRIGVDKGNPQSSAFWSKNSFVKTNEEHQHYVLMERSL